MEIYAGFILGFLGSLHCLGMCGPLIIALPGRSENTLDSIIENLLYNFGRIFTYSTLGGIFGYLGSSLPLAGYQTKVSLALGIIILVVYFSKGKLSKYTSKISIINKISLKFRFLFGRTIQGQGKLNKVIIGIFNGLLPCGLVYVAIASSIAFADFYKGSMYMLLFGLGTLPMMFSIYFMRSLVGAKFKQKLNKVVPAAVLILSTLLILRGLSLGIPMLSPTMPIKVETMEELKKNGDKELAPCCR
jgi:sulfite exporter TauE/SafE